MTTKQPKYTAAMVAAITAASEAHGTLNAQLCGQILQDPAFEGSDITLRGVIAKVRSMRLDYAKAEKVSKTGEPVMTKEAMAAEICRALDIRNLPSLAKAEKTELRMLLNVVHDAFGQPAEADAA